MGGLAGMATGAAGVTEGVAGLAAGTATGGVAAAAGLAVMGATFGDGLAGVAWGTTGAVGLVVGEADGDALAGAALGSTGAAGFGVGAADGEALAGEACESCGVAGGWAVAPPKGEAVAAEGWQWRQTNRRRLGVWPVVVGCPDKGIGRGCWSCDGALGRQQAGGGERCEAGRS